MSSMIRELIFSDSISKNRRNDTIFFLFFNKIFSKGKPGNLGNSDIFHTLLSSSAQNAHCRIRSFRSVSVIHRGMTKAIFLLPRFHEYVASLPPRDSSDNKERREGENISKPSGNPGLLYTFHQTFNRDTRHL